MPVPKISSYQQHLLHHYHTTNQDCYNQVARQNKMPLSEDEYTVQKKLMGCGVSTLEYPFWILRKHCYFPTTLGWLK